MFIATQLNSTELTQFVGRDVIDKNTTDLAARCSTGSVELSWVVSLWTPVYIDTTQLNVELSWVELCRYKHPFRRSMSSSDSRRQEVTEQMWYAASLFRVRYFNVVGLYKRVSKNYVDVDDNRTIMYIIIWIVSSLNTLITNVAELTEDKYRRSSVHDVFSVRKKLRLHSKAMIVFPQNKSSCVANWKLLYRYSASTSICMHHSVTRMFSLDSLWSYFWRTLAYIYRLYKHC